MARTDRLFRLLQAFRTLPQPVTAARLAEETGVSLRTLYRDIDTLRASGAVIDGAAGYGYRMTEDVALPPQTFDRLEIEALVLGLGEAAARGDTGLALAAESALAKIAATLPERQQRQIVHAVLMVYRWEARPGERADLSEIRRACWEEMALDLQYADAEGHETGRRVYPLSMVYMDHAVALLAWCCLRHDFRQFRIDRMVSHKVAQESFRPRRVALLREYLGRLSGDREAGLAEHQRRTFRRSGIA